MKYEEKAEGTEAEVKKYYLYNPWPVFIRVYPWLKKAIGIFPKSRYLPERR